MSKELEQIKQSLIQENISWGEIIYLEEHKEEAKSTGDEVFLEYFAVMEGE